MFMTILTYFRHIHVRMSYSYYNVFKLQTRGRDYGAHKPHVPLATFLCGPLDDLETSKCENTNRVCFLGRTIHAYYLNARANNCKNNILKRQLFYAYRPITLNSRYCAKEGKVFRCSYNNKFNQTTLQSFTYFIVYVRTCSVSETIVSNQELWIRKDVK